AAADAELRGAGPGLPGGGAAGAAAGADAVRAQGQPDRLRPVRGGGAAAVGRLDKSEIRSTKSETMSNPEIRNPKRWPAVYDIWSSIFEFVSDFVLRISDFPGGVMHSR